MKKIYFLVEGKLFDLVIKIVFACTYFFVSFSKKIFLIIIDVIIIALVPVLVYLAIIAGDYYQAGETKNFFLSFMGVIIICILFIVYKIHKTPKCTT